VTCERLATGESVLHRADARVKILLAVGYAVAVAGLGDTLSQILALGGAAALVGLARLPAGEVLRRLAFVNVFVLMLWAILPWSTPGRTAGSLGPATITVEGLRLAMSITLRCNAIILANFALLSTSTIFSLAHALAHLRVPSKLVQLFFFSWRYLHILEQEFNRMRQAVKTRGFEPKSNLHTYRTFAYLFAILLLRSHDRGERVYQAMLCRGFDGTFWILSHFHLHRQDVVLAGVTAFFLAGIMGLGWFSQWR
jgi:cobalt/nickel transport system permease protein